MQRADDFREFISKNRHPLEDSISELPELPAGCDIGFLNTVNDDLPIADNPYSESLYRKGCSALWDSVFISLPKYVSLEHKRSKDITAIRSINTEWEDTKESLSMIGKPDGVHFIRPKGKMILDLMNDDIRILQGAHILTHREVPFIKEDEYTFGQCSDVFLRNILKIFIARKYGLLINTRPNNTYDDSFSLYGIELFGSADLRAPVLFAESGESGRIKQDKTVVCVLGSFGIEAHPKAALEGCSWKEINKWSCLPTLVALAGWECVDYITHTDRTDIRGSVFYASSCSDLQPMSRFDELLEKAKEVRGIPEKSDTIMSVNDWLCSEDFSKGLSVTPQLPCPYCIRMNDKANGIIKKPKTKKPRSSFKDIKSYKSQEIKEWVDYVTFMNNCISIGRSATSYAIGSVTSVKNRNIAFKKRMEKVKRINSLTEKMIRKSNNGFISESEEISIKIENLRKELEL